MIRYRLLSLLRGGTKGGGADRGNGEGNRQQTQMPSQRKRISHVDGNGEDGDGRMEEEEEMQRRKVGEEDEEGRAFLVALLYIPFSSSSKTHSFIHRCMSVCVCDFHT